MSQSSLSLCLSWTFNAASYAHFFSIFSQDEKVKETATKLSPSLTHPPTLFKENVHSDQKT